MTPGETGRVLAVCASFDQRTVAREDVIAWHAVIGALDFDDAVTAVGSYYTQPGDRIMPSDVLEHVRRIRARRREGIREPVPIADPDNAAAYRAELAANRRRIGSTPTPHRELTRG